MTYKSKQSKKKALFSKFLQVFKSRVTGVAGFHDVSSHYTAGRRKRSEKTG